MEKKCLPIVIALLAFFSFLMFSACTDTATDETENPVLKSINVTTPPAKTVYTEGESFDPAGMVVVAFYTNDTYNRIKDYTITPKILSQNTKFVTVSFGGKSTNIQITVNPPPGQKTLTSIAVTTPPAKTEYFAGEIFSTSGMVITALYSDESSETVTAYTVSPSTGLTFGLTSVTISFGGRSTTTPITVKQKTVVSIAVTAPPAKTEYFEGEIFSTSGMVVTATYEDNSTSAVTGYTISPAAGLTFGLTSVTITFSGQTATTPITVKQKTLVSIAVTILPLRREYTAGETFSTNGMVITAAYDNSSTEAVTGYTFSPAAALTTTDTVITISYMGQTALINITVNPLGSYSTDYFSKNFDPAIPSFYDKFQGGSGAGFTAGGVDLGRWGFQNGNGSEYGLSGWGNEERQAYRTENVTVQGGYLRINAKYESSQVNSRSYTSGKLVTANSQGISYLDEPTGGSGLKFGQTYGRFEAKIRMNAGRGAWPAFWMMPVNSTYGGWPRSGEIDIMEMVGIKTTGSSSTLHWRPNWSGITDWQNQYQGVDNTFLSGSTFEDWHVYGVKWTPTEMIFMLDGYKTRTISRNTWNSPWYSENGFPSSTNNYPPFNHDFHFIINLALDSGQFNSGNGIDNSWTTLNYTLDIEWVRAYTLENDPWGDPAAYPGVMSNFQN